MHVPDGFGPPEFLVPGVNASGKGVIEMSNSRDVPGITGQGASWRPCAIDRIGDNQLDDLYGKSICRG